MSRTREPGSTPISHSATPIACAAPSVGARSAMRPLGGCRTAGVGPGAAPGSRSAASGSGPGAVGREARAP